MRAREPDRAGHAVATDGVRLHYEVHGEIHGEVHGELHGQLHGPGSRTVFLLPTWPAVDARIWKLQVAYLARHVRVVVADPRGNGRSDRPTDPSAYADTQLVADAVSVLDETGTDRAVCVGLSMGGNILLQLAAAHPDRTAGAVFLAPSVRVGDQMPVCWGEERFEAPYAPQLFWGRYSADFWRRDLAGFARFFFGEVFSEPHSTKQVDDAVEWTLAAGAETLIAVERGPFLDWSLDGPGSSGVRLAAAVTCPSLVITGDDDRIVPVSISQALADALGCPLELVVGGGHCVQARHPVWFNHRLLRFVRGIDARWIDGIEREVAARARA